MVIQGILYSTSRVRFNQLRCACSKIVWLSCTKLMRNHLLFGKKRQSPAWTVTNDQGTSETFGYFNKSTECTFNREYPPTIWGGSHALYILSSYLYSIIFHSFVPLYKQLIALKASLWRILLVPPPLIHKSTSTSRSFKRPQVRGGMTVTSFHMGVGNSETTYRLLPSSW